MTEVDIVEAENKTERKRLSLVEKTAFSGRENGVREEYNLCGETWIDIDLEIKKETYYAKEKQHD